MDYKNLGIRTASGAVLVALIVFAAIEPTRWAFYAIFGLITLLTTHEFVIVNHGDKLHAYLYSIAALVLFTAAALPVPSFFLGFDILMGYIAYLLVMILIELWLKAENPISNWERLALSQLYVALPMACMAMLREGGLLLALFVLIWVNDSFAFLTGSYLGRHRMFERVSPKKSWEGFIGGNLFTLGAALVFWHFVPEYGWWQWLLIGETVVVFGTLGDLVESLMKRTLGIKDSGNAIPGHGGFLDRFDSAIIGAVALTLLSFVL